MQFKLLTVLSLAAATLAAPSVEKYEKRTESGSCAQGQGTVTCCGQKPELKSTSNLGGTLGPALGGILGIPLGILSILIPNISVAAQCVPIIATQSCSTPNICCLAPSSSNPNSVGLITLLSNNQIVVCPGITA